MKPRLALEDRRSCGRGFFSTLNLLMFAIVWCDENGFHPVAGKSLFKAYAHPFSQPFSGGSPFDAFWNCEYSDSAGFADSVMDIGDIFSLRDWYHDVDSLPRLRELSHAFMSEFLDSRTKSYLESQPSLYARGEKGDGPSVDVSISQPTVSVHYRGCDYLANVPTGHLKNLDPKLYAELIAKIIPYGSRIFVATDDASFLEILLEKSFVFYSFSDVERGNPGRGIHQKNRRQRLGIEWLDRPWLRGVQVVRDCLYLSKANTYIGTNSNLMFFATLLNPQIKSINLMKPDSAES